MKKILNIDKVDCRNNIILIHMLNIIWMPLMVFVANYCVVKPVAMYFYVALCAKCIRWQQMWKIPKTQFLKTMFETKAWFLTWLFAMQGFISKNILLLSRTIVAFGPLFDLIVRFTRFPSDFCADIICIYHKYDIIYP